MSEDNNNNSMIMINSLKYNSTELLLNKIHLQLLPLTCLQFVIGG